LLASISGRVINDLNGNGRLESGEPGLSGVLGTLSGRASATALTNAQGEFNFTNLPPGDYRLTETNLPNFLDSGVSPGVGNVAVDLNNITATLAAGQNSTNNLFLDTQPSERCVPACFNNADMWIINDQARRRVIEAAGGPGAFFILELGRPALSEFEILFALSDFSLGRRALNREYLATQLNIAAYPGAQFNQASCFYQGPNQILRIPGNPRVADLLQRARDAYNGNDLLLIRELIAHLTNINSITSTTGIICPFVDP
jgi:hypothetical protein